MAAVLSGGAAEGERVIRPEFTASAAEYFRIWIVNLLFTLLTLGVYSAWAKVRKRRYFYGSTRVDGASFDYFASPKAILKGRLIAVVVLAAYAFAGQLYPLSHYGFLAAGALALPWLGVRAYQFNARNSGWRGLRFDFVAGTWEAARTYALMLVLLVFTFGLSYAWFSARMRSFVVSHHAFGTSRLECGLRGRDFFKIYFLAGLIAAAIATPGVFLVAFGIAFTHGLGGQAPWAVGMLPLVPVYAGYLVAYAYSESRTGNLIWNSARAPGLSFSSALSARRLAKLYLGNVLATAFSAGLLFPWAVIRTRRYRLSCLQLRLDGEPSYQANPQLPPVGATGQELGDLFNVDLGI